ncbi:LuxR C-terminal-related transcriptional regulator [Methylomonas albis]|uniref:Response regulator transcription factor n=1 Tax=Methylomonas albis TaxID=1854563 RepID=A0ABR9CX43_9GAMM|nr:response regulator transcription factor [Methylomonas albis]MBD9355458.1 response regulator transcription factor [Methylomonas albis]
MSVIRLLLPAPGFAEISLNPEELEKQGIVVMTTEPNTAEPVNFAALDLAMIDGEAALQDNLNLIDQIKAIAPSSKFVVLLRHSSAHAVSYMQAGVTGLLAALPDAVKLAEIIRKLVQGDYYLDQDIAQLLAMRQIKKQLDPFISLSSREFDVFCLLAEGCSLQTIALQLGISSKTVSNCQTQIRLKLAIDSREKLTKFANAHGLIIHKGV